MRCRRVLLPGVLVALALAAPAHAATPSVERAADSTVAITSYADRIGTGVVIAEDRVLTAAHVVDGAAGTPTHLIANETLVPYEVLAIDRTRDLALLAADLPDGVPAIVWADDAELVLGQDVIALGFPIGLTSVTLSKGVVSAPSQEYAGATFIQTDAAINPGNSGGPLVDEYGRLVGLSVAKIAQVEVDAVGFAVPAADILTFLEQEAPGLSVLRDTSAGTPAGEATEAPAAGDEPSNAAIVLAVGLSLALVFGAFVLWRRRSRVVAEAETTDDLPTRPRAVFRVSAPGQEEEFDVRLPSVAGTAPNADIPIAGEGASAYHVRFSPVSGGVTALDLTDGQGMYCGDACVLTAVLAPGESVRLGSFTITLVRAYEA